MEECKHCFHGGSMMVLYHPTYHTHQNINKNNHGDYLDDAANDWRRDTVICCFCGEEKELEADAGKLWTV